MDYIARLREVITPLHGDDEWDSYEGDVAFGTNEDPTRHLLAVRPLGRHLVSMLRRLDDTGAPWTFTHVMRRIYSLVSPSLFPDVTPLATQLRHSSAGGKACLVVTHHIAAPRS